MASRKMIVSAASSMLSAISLGVFCRLAPSTMAIIRSRKLSPGLAVTRTISQSDRTCGAAGDGARSPPRLADDRRASPVMAASSTEAMPSIDFTVTAGWSRRLPRAQRRPGARSRGGNPVSLGHRGCGRGQLLAPALPGARPRSVSACALPRPSAIASAKLAKNTVTHSQRETARMNPGASRRSPPRAREEKSQWSASLPMNTANITGLRIWWRGWSLAKESSTARRTMAGSKTDVVALLSVSSLPIDRLVPGDVPQGGTATDGARRSAPTPGPE